MPKAEHTKKVVSANVACVISISYNSPIALTPKLCTPIRAAARSAKKQKHDRIVGENNSDKFLKSDLKLRIEVSSGVIESRLLSFKSLPKIIKKPT